MEPTENPESRAPREDPRGDQGGDDRQSHHAARRSPRPRDGGGAADKIQLTAHGDADLEIVLTKDPNVLEDPQGTPAPQRKVLGYFYPGKTSAQRMIANPGTDTIYAVVQSDVQGKVATGKYTLGARKLQ